MLSFNGISPYPSGQILDEGITLKDRGMHHIQLGQPLPDNNAEHRATTEFLERARRVVDSLTDGVVMYDIGDCKVLAFPQHHLVVKMADEAELRRTERAFLLLSKEGYSPPRALFLEANSDHVALLVMEQIPREQIAGARRLYCMDEHGQRMRELVREGERILHYAGFRRDAWIPDEHGSNMAITPDAAAAATRGKLTRKHLIPFDPVL